MIEESLLVENKNSPFDESVASSSSSASSDSSTAASSSTSSLPLISSFFNRVTFKLPSLEEDKKADAPEEQARLEKNIVLDLLDQVSEKREWSAQVQQILTNAQSQIFQENPNLTALEILSAATVQVAIGFELQISALKMQLKEIEKQHRPRKGLALISTRKPTSDEQYMKEKTSVEQNLASLLDEQIILSQLFVKAIHQQVLRSPIVTEVESLLTDIKTIKWEKSIWINSNQLPLPYQNLVSPSDLLPQFVDYSSELQPVENQFAAQVTGASMSIKTIQELQDSVHYKWIERLSAASLEYLAGDTDLSVDLLTQTLQTKGIASDLAWIEFLDQKLTHPSKANAILQAKAALHMTDSINLIPDLGALKSALFMQGPLLLTLPVYNWDAKSYLSFWVPSSSSDPILGYETVLIVGYNDETATAKIRGHFGRSWGTFGYMEMSYTDVFSSPHVVLALVSNAGTLGMKKPSSRKLLNVSKGVISSQELFPETETQKQKARGDYYKRQFKLLSQQLKTQ